MSYAPSRRALDPRALAILFLVASMSLLAFTACVYDKHQARVGRRRVRERSLLFLATVGGSPGLLLGMLVARHKTRKASFLARLFVIILLQAALAWILLDQAA